MKKGLVFLLALFTCFMLVGCGKKVNNTGDNNGNGNSENTGENGNNGNTGENGNNGENGNTGENGNNGENGNTGENTGDNGEKQEEKIQSITLNNSSKELKLTRDHENYKVNDLILRFYGEDATNNTGVKDSYRYVLTIEKGEMEINSNIYSNPFKRIINSSNLSSTFVVYAIDDVYVLKSTTGAQIDGENVLFFDKNGNFIDSFEDITAGIDINKRTMDYTNCITTDPEENCVKAKYKITKSELIKQ